MTISYRAQFRALAHKNLTLQIRRKGSTACQIILPILCVLAAGLVQTFANSDGSGRIYNGWTDWQTIDQLNGYYTNAFFTNPQNPMNDKAGVLTSNASRSGMIGEIPQQYWYFYGLAKGIYSPFFTEFSSSDEMYANVQEVYQNMSTRRCYFYYDCPPIPSPVVTYNFQEISISSALGPDHLSYTVQADNRNPTDMNTYSGTYSYSFFITMMSNALLNFQTGLQNTTIVSGFTPFPVRDTGSNLAGSLFSLFVFPFSVSFLLPVYMHTIVQEKKSGLIQMMQVSGLSMVSYWVINYLYHFMVFTVFAAVMMVFGLGFGVVVFWTNLWQIIVLLFLWGNAQIMFCYLMTCFISSPNAANIFGFLLAIFGSIVGTILEIFVFLQYPADMPSFLYLLYPGFVFTHGFSLTVFSVLTDVVKSNSFMLGTTFSNMLLILLAEIIVFAILLTYFEAVMPRDIGIPKHPLFPLIWVHKKIKKTFSKYEELGEHELLLSKDSHMLNVIDKTLQMDVQEEQTAAHTSSPNDMVRILSLSKIYKSSNGNPAKVALKDVSFRIMKNECFGLLGPNGAGKTTLINVLSGSSIPSSGTAIIDNIDIRQNITEVHKQIGVCPQFDVLWDELTVSEHLLFYSRMKAYTASNERAHAHKVVEDVGLEEVEQRFAKDLSGGQKRRLSIAISMMGKPKLILMDEPTTGLDPSSRRALWDIIVKAKEQHSIILSTHSMEEAEVLCSRIGIMRKAQLHSIGTQLQLKTKFGLGYNIKISHVLNMGERASNYVKSLLPGAVCVHTFGGTQSYKVQKGEFVLSDLFTRMETHKARHGIKQWSISQASLEEVFLAIVTEDESDENLVVDNEQQEKPNNN